MIWLTCLEKTLEWMLETKLVHTKSRILLRLIRLHTLLVLGTRSTFEHISQYLTQLGEAGSINELKVRLFSLSLTGTAFSWFFIFGT